MEQITLNTFPDSNEIWSGIGGHFDSLGQIINEFVDNSISNFEANNPLLRYIFITLKEVSNNGDVSIRIEDSGTGIKDLDQAFTLGSKKAAESPLNEHGFGLKHALASANPLLVIEVPEVFAQVTCCLGRCFDRGVGCVVCLLLHNAAV